jgi:hypothetical protein
MQTAAPQHPQGIAPGTSVLCWAISQIYPGATNTGFKKIIFKQKALRGYLFES